MKQSEAHYTVEDISHLINVVDGAKALLDAVGQVDCYTENILCADQQAFAIMDQLTVMACEMLDSWNKWKRNKMEVRNEAD